MDGEPPLEDVRAAVFSLPREDLEALASGPIESDDPDDCRICEHYDDHVFLMHVRGPHDEAIATLIDWHRWWGAPNHDGRGPEAFRRCQVIYELAREALA